MIYKAIPCKSVRRALCGAAFKLLPGSRMLKAFVCTSIVLCLGKSRFQVQEHCLGTRQDAHGAMLMPRETVADEILSDTGNLCLCRHEALQEGEYG